MEETLGDSMACEREEPTGRAMMREPRDRAVMGGGRGVLKAGEGFPGREH